MASSSVLQIPLARIRSPFHPVRSLHLPPHPNRVKQPRFSTPQRFPGKGG
ncbi:MAG: hypothetical protein P5702_10800 [Limnospira sp. PMC 1291.21]|nr:MULTISPECIES: hypothetical protein [Limnospira]MDC0837043.1 hypothetical protein [Limnoraphis robusta]MDT9188249.1 hypothetical protein [Limnospira sp. PMC 894.15]MDT9249716.1 hypothetical protein [Limnospira sp. PMC 1280.21]MDT9315548.1 hypothetical protein [Limnospira sp. PMC 1306.21]MDY7051017.1 hypothetical protein [Limnospira fusiformis LS22]